MEQMIGYCGIVCSSCPAYLATMKNDNELRIRTAETWSKEFQANLKPHDINCVGCLVTEGVLFSHCKVCEIRKCGQPRHIENCAQCEEYTCEKLNNFHKMVPDAKKVLDAVKRRLSHS